MHFEVLSNLHEVPSSDLVLLRWTQHLCSLLDSDSVDWWPLSIFVFSVCVQLHIIYISC